MNALRRERRPWGLVIVLLSLCAIYLTALLLFSFDEGSPDSVEWLPISLRSDLTADYGSEPNPNRLMALEWKLVEDSIRDEERGNPSATSRLAALTSQMQTPVSAVAPPTPVPTSNPQPAAFQPTQPAHPTVGPQPSIPPTAVVPTVPRATPAPPPSATLVAVPSDKPTKEPKPTPLPIATDEPKPTKTPKPTRAK